MSRYNTPFEIHVHGQVSLRGDVTFEHVQDALKPIWKYAGARSLTDAAGSFYEDEPGIRFDAQDHVLQMCWTIEGDDDFRQVLDEMCMNLNDVAITGAAIEVTFYDTEFEDEDEDEVSDAESRDDFIMLFVGPDPAAIMQVQRDLLVQDVISLMERHFDGAELGGVVPRGGRQQQHGPRRAQTTAFALKAKNQITRRICAARVWQWRYGALHPGRRQNAGYGHRYRRRPAESRRTCPRRQTPAWPSQSPHRPCWAPPP